MTLVWLGLVLALLVWAAVFMVWDSGVQFARQMRAVRLAAERRDRQSEDRAWATSRHVEYQHAMSISLTRANIAAADDLIDALTTPKHQMDVVA